MCSDMATSHLTLKDIAREVGVSVATLDRVLHGRAGVREETVRRVREAIDRRGFRPFAAGAELAGSRASRLAFVMPESSNVFMSMILDHIAEMSGWLTARRTTVETTKTNVFNPAALARTLESLAGRYDGVAVVALDHQSVRAAIDDLVAEGTYVVTLVSDVPGSRRHHYIGIDNVAAGRTAGSLVGRFAPATTGKIGVIAGSQLLRDHAERVFGFNQVMSLEYPGLEVLSPVEGNDEDELSESLTMRLLAEHPDLIGLYSAGAGAPGIAKAMADAGRDGGVVFVAHELTAFSRRALLRGTLDAVISQDPGHEARSAIRVLSALVRNEPILSEQEKIRIDIVMRDNLP